MKHSFPVVKGRQNGNVYFLGTMSYNEVASLLKLPEDPYWNGLVAGGGLAMQREVNWKRVRGEMKDYLLKTDDPFFSALTLIIVPPTARPLEEGEDYEFRPATNQHGTNQPYGILELDGSTVFFPADGQHRSAAIREALLVDREMARQEVPVVLIPFPGEDKVRQLFSDLNLHAKVPNRTLGLAFESRDPIAILSKQLAKIVPLFIERVNARTNSLSASSDKVIALNTLNACNAALLRAIEHDKDKDEFKEMLDELRGSAADSPDVTELAYKLAGVWEVIIDNLLDEAAEPAWVKVLDEDIHPRELREKYIFPHGLGWQAIANAASIIIQADPEGWEDTLATTLTEIDWRRDEHWDGIAMAGARVNNTGPGINATTGYILFQAGFNTDPDTLPDEAPEKPYLAAFKRAINVGKRARRFHFETAEQSAPAV